MKTQRPTWVLQTPAPCPLADHTESRFTRTLISIGILGKIYPSPLGNQPRHRKQFQKERTPRPCNQSFTSQPRIYDAHRNQRWREINARHQSRRCALNWAETTAAKWILHLALLTAAREVITSSIDKEMKTNATSQNFTKLWKTSIRYTVLRFPTSAQKRAITSTFK